MVQGEADHRVVIPRSTWSCAPHAAASHSMQKINPGGTSVTLQQARTHIAVSLWRSSRFEQVMFGNGSYRLLEISYGPGHTTACEILQCGFRLPSSECIAPCQRCRSCGTGNMGHGCSGQLYRQDRAANRLERLCAARRPPGSFVAVAKEVAQADNESRSGIRSGNGIGVRGRQDLEPQKEIPLECRSRQPAGTNRSRSSGSWPSRQRPRQSLSAATLRALFFQRSSSVFRL
jgi:hypothetical protein